MEENVADHDWSFFKIRITWRFRVWELVASSGQNKKCSSLQTRVAIFCVSHSWSWIIFKGLCPPGCFHLRARSRSSDQCLCNPPPPPSGSLGDAGPESHPKAHAAFTDLFVSTAAGHEAGMQERNAWSQWQPAGHLWSQACGEEPAITHASLYPVRYTHPGTGSVCTV